MDAGDEEALKNFLDGGRRLGIRTDCNPTLGGEVIFYLQNPECTRIMNDFTNYLSMVDRIHSLYCELFMYKCGMIS